MTFYTTYPSPLGRLTLVSNGTHITGLWLPGQTYDALPCDAQSDDGLSVFRLAAQWLDAYFGGEDLPPIPPLAPEGTAFRKAVWEALREIPYGEVTTYGAIAEKLAWQGIQTSPRAVGGAVGRNPISILIHCHRVIGADGTLTGYAGGLEAKRFLLDMEALYCREESPESDMDFEKSSYYGIS